MQGWCGLMDKISDAPSYCLTNTSIEVLQSYFTYTDAKVEVHQKIRCQWEIELLYKVFI